MNRRSFLTAIPAAVAALTASKSLAGATSPVAASAAIVRPFELWDTVTGNLVGCYDSVPALFADLNEAFAAGEDRSELSDYALVPFWGADSYGPEIIRFPDGNTAVFVGEWTVPPHTYVAPRGVE